MELNEDLTGIVEQSDRVLFHAPAEGMRLRCEGCRAYVKDGWIYLLLSNGQQIRRRRQVYAEKSVIVPET